MKKIFIFLFLFFIGIFNVKAVVTPTMEFYVNDYANILSEKTEEEIFQNSIKLNNKDGSQLVVVTVTSLGNMSIENYANKLYNSWGIGTKEKNNGLLILVSKNDRKIRVEVGYGFEGIINDGKAGRFIDDYAIGFLKQNKWDEGILNLYNAFFSEIVKQNNLGISYNEPSYIYNSGSQTSNKSLPTEFFMVPMVLGVIAGIITRRKFTKLLDIIVIIVIIVVAGSLVGPYLVNLPKEIETILLGSFLGFIIGFLQLRGGFSSGGGSGGGGFSGGGGRSGGGGASRGF